MGWLVFLTINPNSPELRMDMSITWCVGDDNWKHSICIERRKWRGIICEAGEGADLENGVMWGRLSNHLQPEAWLKSSWQDNFKRCFSSAWFCFQEETRLEGSSGETSCSKLHKIKYYHNFNTGFWLFHFLNLSGLERKIRGSGQVLSN